MAYGDNRHEVVVDNFDASIDANWNNGQGDFDTLNWVAGGHVEPAAALQDGFIQRNLEGWIESIYATVTVQSFGSGAVIGAALRASNDATDESAYIGVVEESSGDYIIYRTNVNKAFNVVATTAASAALSAGDTITLEVEGTTLRLGTKEGAGADTERVNTTDANISQGIPGAYVSDDTTAGNAQITSFAAGYINCSVLIKGVTIFETTGAAVTTQTINRPDGAEQGDALLVFVHPRQSGDSTISADSTNGNWRLIGQFSERLLYLLPCGEGAPDASWTITHSSATEGCGVCMRISGHDLRSFTDVEGSTVVTTANPAVATAPTTVTNGALVLYNIGVIRRAVVSCEVALIANATSGGGSLDTNVGVAAKAQPTAGAPGSASFTLTASASFVSFGIAIRPDQGSPPLIRVADVDINAETSGATSITADTPGLAASGDLLLKLVVMDGNETDTFSIADDTTNGAWTVINAGYNNDDVTVAAFLLHCASGAPDASHVISWTASEEAHSASLVLRGHDTTTPLDATAVESGSIGDALSFSATGVTTVTNDAAVFFFAGLDRREVAGIPPGPVMAAIDQTDLLPSFGISVKHVPTAGASGSSGNFEANGALDGWAALAIPIRPAATGGTPVEGTGSSTGSGTVAGVSSSINSVDGQAAGGQAVASGESGATVAVDYFSASQALVAGSAGSVFAGSISSAGTSVAAAVGAALTASEISAAGAAASAASSCWLFATLGASAGVAAVSGQSAATATADATSVGTGAGSGVAATIASTEFSATGSAVVAGVGEDGQGNAVEGTGTSVGVAAVSGVAAYAFTSDGVSTGSAAAAGVSSQIVSTEFSAAGSATALAVTDNTQATDASATGVATVSGDGVLIVAAEGSASGSALVAGQSSRVATSEGTAAGQSVPAAISAKICGTAATATAQAVGAGASAWFHGFDYSAAGVAVVSGVLDDAAAPDFLRFEDISGSMRQTLAIVGATGGLQQIEGR